MLLVLSALALPCRAVESKAAGEWRAGGWPESRSDGYERSPWGAACSRKRRKNSSKARLPGFLDRLRVEEPQSREPLRHSGRGQLSLPEQIRLLFADVLRSERIGWTSKVTGKIFDGLDLAVDGSLSVITTREFFEHHSAKVGHRRSPYDPTLSLPPHCRHHTRESVCRRAASSKPASGRSMAISPKPTSGPRR